MNAGAPIARQLAPASSRLAIEQATAALCAGDLAEAELTLRRHLLQRPADPAALAKLAEMAISQGRLEEAAIALRQAADADPCMVRCLQLPP